jgi:AcrR family transcriptional regulator
VFVAAANAFSRDGLDGVGVDDIAKAAGVNKAMIYYHFKDKLTLYREVVRDMLRALGAAVADLGAIEDTPARKIERFIETIGELRDARPWFPPLMMREMSAGAPHLDDATMGHMRNVFVGFSAILEEGVQAGAFRRVNPLMAYMSIMGPLMMNAMRERAASTPGRKGHAMFMTVDRQDLITHIQENALRMLAPEAVRKEHSRLCAAR